MCVKRYHNLFSIFFRKLQRVPVLILHGHIRRIRVGQQFHLGNGVLGAAAKIAGFNDRRFIRVYANAIGHQCHIPPLHIGNLCLRFRTHAAFLVHNSVTDCIKKLILRPGKLRLFIIFHHCQIGFVLSQIRFDACIRGPILFREPLFNQISGFACHKLLILFFCPCLIIGRVLLQIPDIRAFIIFRTRDQPRVDPMVDQVFRIYVISVIRLGQCVNQASSLCFQLHVAFVRNDGAHTHIPIFFRQINILLRFCVYTAGIGTGPVRFRKRIHNNSLLWRSVIIKRADAAVYAGQMDFMAFYRQCAVILGNIARCF